MTGTTSLTETELRYQLPEIITAALPGEKAVAILARRSEAIPPSLTCVYPVAIAKAEGAIIEDVDGNHFLDWVGGVGVLNIGHRHPKVVEAVKQQENDYFHAMINILTSEKYIALAEKMNEIVPVKGFKKRTFFANSGAEAIENGVKVARAYTKRPNVIVFSGAFHGRTLLTTHMTAKKANSIGLGPFPDGIFRVDYPNLYRKPAYYTDEEAVAYYIERIKRAFDELTPASQVAAIVFEPVQGEGGFIPAPIEWVKAVRQICDENGIMMMTDEVQTGFGRTGKLFASSYYEEAGCAPDILCTAKSIAGGFPLSAIVARDEIVKGIGGGLIGGTFGGNSVSCAAALATIQVIEDENLCERSLELGAAYTARVEEWQQQYKEIGDVRGLGGMIGVEFIKDRLTKEPAPELVNALIQHCVQNGLIIENAGTYGNVVRFLAPLVMTDEQLEAGLAIFENAIDALCTKLA